MTMQMAGVFGRTVGTRGHVVAAAKEEEVVAVAVGVEAAAAVTGAVAAAVAEAAVTLGAASTGRRALARPRPSCSR